MVCSLQTNVFPWPLGYYRLEESERGLKDRIIQESVKAINVLYEINKEIVVVD